jgi:hypothetical protein
MARRKEEESDVTIARVEGGVELLDFVTAERLVESERRAVELRSVLGSEDHGEVERLGRVLVLQHHASRKAELCVRHTTTHTIAHVT